MPNDVNGLGDKIVSSVRGFVARSLEALETRIDALEARAWPVDGKDGRDGIDGKDGTNGTDGIDGRHGVDGKDGTPGVDGRHGVDGINGKDGTSVSLEDVEAMVALRFANYVVEYERRLPEVLQRLVDRLEKPRDGVNGKDGRDGKDGKDGVDGKHGEDGFDLRHFDVEQIDERSFMLRFKDLTREKKHTLVFPVPIQRGIWKAEQPYARGDIVTWGGSQFEKLTDEPGGKPEESPAWRLVVKRGRDGKDGQKGDKGDTGKAGRNGRDLTQMGSDGSKW